MFYLKISLDLIQLYHYGGSVRIHFVFFVLILSASQLFAALKLPAVISDRMVLQQQLSLPIWGWGDAGQEVSVSFAGQTQTTTVKANGEWRVNLNPLKASSENRIMKVTMGTESKTLNDVVVGEVWICSGQSNMGWSLNGSAQKTKDPIHQPIADWTKKELETEFDPLIRQISSPTITSYNEEKNDIKGSWVEANSANNKKNFTAVGYFFAKELRRKLNVPVGLLKCPWGGKKIQPFIPSTQYKKDPELNKYYNDSLANLEKVMKTFDPAKLKAKNEAAMAKWKEKSKKAKADGKAAPRRPRNGVSPALNPNFPSTLYNSMINPLVPFGVKGAIWYQGESNAGSDAPLYGKYLKTLIDGWRDRWGQNDFPLYYCQLASFQKPSNHPLDKNSWVTVCDEMRRALSHKNMGMAVLNDVGEATDIHPRNKKDPGERLAYWALAKDYGFTDTVYSGPLYKSHSIKGNQVTIKFDSVGKGLMTARKHLLDPAKAVDEKLQGFQICGADRKWKWAEASIINNSEVTVSHPEIANPTIVRYAWAPNPIQANLYNKSGLPTSVFSTKD